MIDQNKILNCVLHFDVEGPVVDIFKIETGHINGTYAITCKKEDGSTIRYILQSINTKVFTRPVELMENIQNVTDYLRGIILENGGDVNRETLTVIRAKTGLNYYVDEENRYWRMYNYIEDATSYQTVERPILFENAAKAFGHFQKQLAGYPADTLHETIAQFHDTVKRFRDFEEAVAKDAVGRAASVQPEIEFFLSHKDICDTITSRIATGEIPLRVTHNDTKLNNIMIDNETDEGICIIDLDTVMPGSALYDFGDSIRFGASSAAEDEKDLSKVNFRIDLFEAYTRGYLQEAKDTLNETEKDLLAMSAIILTLECGMRFLGDYLNGDIYFGIHRPEHNLDRARTQIKLVADMESQLDAMNAVVAKYR
ncbi:MAG: phosphotransferase [Clostridia bacterium]|nr:phosphotransferase [Clostridia bacterium]